MREWAFIKLLKFLVILLMVGIGMGYGVYYFGTNIIADKVLDHVSVELEDSGQFKEVKQMISEDPAVKEYIANGENMNENKLPFTTKELAAKVLIQKVGLTELQNIQARFQNGVSNNEIEELLKSIEGKLTAEEIAALKIIVYEELSK